MKKSSKTKPRSSRFTTRRKCPRGWPVVATGGRDLADFERYITWRTLLELPEESTDFSDRDVFDVAAYVLDRFGGDGFADLQRKFPSPAPRHKPSDHSDLDSPSHTVSGR